jgi:hypothetical protein
VTVLTPAEIDTLTDASVRHLAPARLENYVRQHKQIEKLDEFIKAHSVGQSDPRTAVTRGILAHLNDLGQADILAQALFMEMGWNEDFQRAVGPLTRAARQGTNTRQAMLARRDHFLSDAALQEFANETMPRICCLVGEYEIAGQADATNGTGFLVGPDLIVTAMHVVDALVLAGRKAEVPTSFRAIFDHDLGDPIQSLADIDSHPSIRVVAFASDWLVANSARSDPDGIDDDPEVERSNRYRQRLDFALIRLAEPVGAQPVRGGGRTRGWVQPNQPAPTSYQSDTRIFIPQHPYGSARVADFGRINRLCTSGTRVISAVETAPGTSGAPCLDNKGQLIAMHNAEYRPNMVPVGNQAIRFDAIQSKIADKLKNSVPAADPPIWNAGQGGDMKPIIGRDPFLHWIRDSRAALPSARGERSLRLYAAEGTGKGAGRTFSIEILNAVLGTGAADLRIVFGSVRSLPDRLELFLADLLRDFGITARDGESPPPRPGPELVGGPTVGDKIQRWASQKVPEWFAQMLDKHRLETVDRTAAAQSAVASNKLLGRESDAELVALAEAPDPVIETRARWERAWIVLDDQHARELPVEIQSFVAGMIGADADENTVPESLRRLRWLFLGKLPGFLQPADITTESLDPGVVDPVAIAALMNTALAAADRTTQRDLAEEARSIRSLAGLLQSRMQMVGEYNTLLAMCQFLVGTKLTELLAETAP